MNQTHTGLYRLMRWILGLALGFYFRRIDRFHSSRVPEDGPLLFTSNHPNSLTDSFVIGAAVPRKVNFVATVQLFRFKLVKWFLLRCGVIPINRLKDDPKGMRSVSDTFEACYRVLERGEAIGIFPEGVTYDDSRLREVKSGAARMALDLESRHQGKIGLKIVPVGLTYSAKELYRSDVLVHFGEPIRAAEFLEGYAEHRKECIHRLTAEIERRIQSLILHIPELEHTRIVQGVKRLYLEQLRLGTRIAGDSLAPRAEELVLGQRIAAAVDHVHRTDPERAAVFAARLAVYERWLARLRLSDESLQRFPHQTRLAARTFLWAAIAVVGLPIAVYGWIHRIVPHWIIAYAVKRFPAADKRKAQTSTTKILGGILLYGGCFAGYIAIVHAWLGWPLSFWYGLSLPPSTLLAFYHLREWRRMRNSVRDTIILLRAPFAARKLLRMRAELIGAIERVREELGTVPQGEPR